MSQENSIPVAMDLEPLATLVTTLEARRKALNDAEGAFRTETGSGGGSGRSVPRR